MFDGKVGRELDESGGGRENAPVVIDTVNDGEESRNEVRLLPCAYCYVDSFVAGQVESGDGGFQVFNDLPRLAVVPVLGVEGGK